MTIQLTLNGAATELKVEPSRSLLWVLRTELGLTGTKYGCGEGDCGACTVLLDGEAVRACTLTVGDAAGKALVTIEGLASGAVLHPLQEAFVKHDALQCGFCTPGMIMNAAALLKKTPTPTRDQIIAGMEGNLCRCGAHPRILDAIEEAAGRGAAREGGAK